MTALARWWASPPPAIGIEITTTRVTAVCLGRGSDGPAVVAHASEPLPPGALVPSLAADNVANRTVTAHAVHRVLEEVGRPKRVALVIPDAAAKVSMVRFEKVPARAQDLEQMVRWQVRKAVPFPIEAAQVGFAPSLEVDGGHEFVVVVIRRDVVESYEALVHASGAHAGLIDLASFNLVNLVLAADRKSGTSATGDWLLVHLTPHASTLAIVRERQLVFYRNRVTDGQEPLVELVHQTSMYYEDRLGGRGFDRVMLTATSDALAAESADVRRTLEERLRSPVELVDPRRAATLAGPGTVEDEQLVSIAAPLGVLLREVA